MNTQTKTKIPELTHKTVEIGQKLYCCYTHGSEVRIQSVSVAGIYRDGVVDEYKSHYAYSNLFTNIDLLLEKTIQLLKEVDKDEKKKLWEDLKNNN
jgi:hypothetical protein